MTSQDHPAQSLIDALSVALGRSVVLDDPALVPLAFSRQWDVDEVRSKSILGRGASSAVRKALLGQGIASARDLIHTAPDPELGMVGRVCMPVREGERVLGYIFLQDPADDLDEDDLERVRRAAPEMAALLLASDSHEVPDEAELVEALRSHDPELRRRGAEDARRRHLLGDGPLVLCLIAPTDDATEAASVARRAVRRLSVGQAVAAAVAEGSALIAALGDPVLRTLPESEIGAWLRAVVAVDVAVGQSAAATLTSLDEASRQAGLALRLARSRPTADAVAAWSALGADRLIAQLPAAASRDFPEGLTHLLHEEPALVATLAAFLDAGGDIKSTAAALSLHRSGLYYRLRRIEDLTGLDLDRGDDRLLAHLAIRTEQMS